MGDGVTNAGMRGGDPPRATDRVQAAARAAARPEKADPARPPAGEERPRITAPEPLDAMALGEARDRIAATLAATGDVGDALIPIAPGSDADTVADAQALARLIVANGRPARLAQARLGADAVRVVIGD